MKEQMSIEEMKAMMRYAMCGMIVSGVAMIAILAWIVSEAL